MVQKCHIRCKARKGAFHGEMVVSFPIVDSSGQDREAVSVVAADSVQVLGRKPLRGGASEAALKAYCLQRRRGLVAVALPQPTFQNGASVIVRSVNLI